MSSCLVNLSSIQGFNVEVSPSERAMLGYFLAKLHRVDPDLIVGHNLTGFGFEVLQHRLGACQVPQWSRVGRLKRKDMPKVRGCESRCDVMVTGHVACAGAYDWPATVCRETSGRREDFSTGAHQS